MAKIKKPKGWVKRNRAWINSPASGCMAGVSWYVSLEYHREWDRQVKERMDTYTASVNSEIEINDDAQRHYVSRKADLRPLRAMRKELDAYEETALQALTEAEEYNESS